VKIKRSTSGAALAASAALLLAACGGSADASGESSGGSDDLGAVAMGFSSADITIWNDQLEIMRPIVEEAGYEFLTSDPQNDIQRQISDWQGWVNRGDVKAIMGFPVQTDSIVPTTQQAVDAGIPVLGYLVTWDGVSAATVVDSYQGGYDLGELTAQQLAEEQGEDAAPTVAVLGDRTSDFTALAMDGLAEGVRSVLPDAEIVELTASTREEGYNVTQSQLVADPGTKVFLGASNDSAHGAYQALIDHGVAEDDPEYTVASRDATNETLDMISIPGSIYRTSIVVPAQGLAEANAELLIAAAHGEEVEDLVVPSIVVTAENAADYYVD
jgi:ribose transport system substrate-binding protein